MRIITHTQIANTFPENISHTLTMEAKLMHNSNHQDNGKKLYCSAYNVASLNGYNRITLGDFKAELFLRTLSKPEVNRVYKVETSKSHSSNTVDNYHTHVYTFSPIHIAAKLGDTELVTNLLEKGADINLAMNDVHTLEKIYEGAFGERTADIAHDSTSEKTTNSTVLDIAIENNHRDLVRFLHSKKASCSDSNNHRVFYILNPQQGPIKKTSTENESYRYERAKPKKRKKTHKKGSARGKITDFFSPAKKQGKRNRDESNIRNENKKQLRADDLDHSTKKRKLNN